MHAALACSPNTTPDYSVSSGFALDSLAPGIRRSSKTSVSPAVYGVTSSTTILFRRFDLNVDYELFGLLPQVAKATPAKRNKVLSEWVKGLGRFSTDKAEYDEA